jgi:chaperone modulatory protein CbpM
MADDLLNPVDDETPLEMAELLAASGLAHEELVELVEFGVFETN